MKKLHTTQNRVFLYLLKSMLEKNGIQCLLKNEEVAGQAAGELPPVVAKPELWVMSDNDYPAAYELVQAELAHQSQPKHAWVCPKCKEKLEGQFEVCWNCGEGKA